MRSVVIQQTGVGASSWVPLDQYVASFSVGIGVVVTGVVTYTIEYTYDDVFNNSITPTAWPVLALNGLAVNADAQLSNPVKALRINQTAGAGTTAMTVVQGGVIG